MSKRRETTSRERIIDAALEVFADVHFHEATIREIAQRAGISQAAVYKHFESKEHVLSCAAAQQLHTMLQEVNQHLLGVQGTLNRLRKMTWYYLSTYEQDWRVAWLLYISVPVRNWYELTQATQEGKETTLIFRKILHEGQEAGEVREDIDTRAAASMYFGTLANLTTGWLLRGRSYRLTDSADSFSEMVFQAMEVEKKQVGFECPFSDKAMVSTNARKAQP